MFNTNILSLILFLISNILILLFLKKLKWTLVIIVTVITIAAIFMNLWHFNNIYFFPYISIFILFIVCIVVLLTNASRLKWLWVLATIPVTGILLFIVYKTTAVYLNLPIDKYNAYQIEAGGAIKLKNYPNKVYWDETIITNKQDVEKILEYLNSIPLIPVSEKNYERSENTSEVGTSIFIAYNGTHSGWVSFPNEEYIGVHIGASPEGYYYKVRDREIKVLSGLEALDLSGP